jgi:hypothetical protein
MLPPGLEPETFALPDTRIEVLVRRSNQLSYGSQSAIADVIRCCFAEVEEDPMRCFLHAFYGNLP